jgi:hypothetical protein
MGDAGGNARNGTRIIALGIATQIGTAKIAITATISAPTAIADTVPCRGATSRPAMQRRLFSP